MKVGDLIKLPIGVCTHWGFPEPSVAILVGKLPRPDELEYDWSVFVEGKTIELGRQIEHSIERLDLSKSS